VRFDIPDSELQWTFDTSGGPGGQHANRSNTRVELTFDIEHSGAFDETTRSRLVGRLGPEVRVTEGGSRSQATNRKRATRSLEALLEVAARPDPPPRRRTRPSLAARRRRLADKRARSELKRSRRSPGNED
jgi:ribosome-associated protein